MNVSSQLYVSQACSQQSAGERLMNEIQGQYSSVIGDRVDWIDRISSCMRVLFFLIAELSIELPVSELSSFRKKYQILEDGGFDGACASLLMLRFLEDYLQQCNEREKNILSPLRDRLLKGIIVEETICAVANVYHTFYKSYKPPLFSLNPQYLREVVRKAKRQTTRTVRALTGPDFSPERELLPGENAVVNEAREISSKKMMDIRRNIGGEMRFWSRGLKAGIAFSGGYLTHSVLYDIEPQQFHYDLNIVDGGEGAEKTYLEDFSGANKGRVITTWKEIPREKIEGKELWEVLLSVEYPKGKMDRIKEKIKAILNWDYNSHFQCELQKTKSCAISSKLYWIKYHLEGRNNSCVDLSLENEQQINGLHKRFLLNLIVTYANRLEHFNKSPHLEKEIEAETKRLASKGKSIEQLRALFEARVSLLEDVQEILKAL